MESNSYDHLGPAEHVKSGVMCQAVKALPGLDIITSIITDITSVYTTVISSKYISKYTTYCKKAYNDFAFVSFCIYPSYLYQNHTHIQYMAVISAYVCLCV